MSTPEEVDASEANGTGRMRMATRVFLRSQKNATMPKPDEKLTAIIRSQMPFASFLDLSIVEMSPERVVGMADWTTEKSTTGGAMHGGYLMGCVDAIGAIAAFHNLPKGSTGTTTIESKTNFFSAVREGSIRVQATPVHVGRTTIVVQTDVLDDRERLVSRTTQTQLVLGSKQGG
jgi:uncharacterized protein (TIGR00369 family)